MSTTSEFDSLSLITTVYQTNFGLADILLRLGKMIDAGEGNDEPDRGLPSKSF